MTDSSTNTASVRIPLNEFENLMVGAVGGAFETSVQMPLLTLKFTVQEGRPYPKHIGGWFRGVFAQASSVAPITALQVMTNGFFGRLLRQGELRELSNGEQVLASMSAGAVSAFIYGPADLVTIQQQKLGQGPLPTIRHISSTYGVTGIFRGLGATIVREAIYTCGFLGVAPILTKFIRTGLDTSELAATLSGSCIAGTGAALLTHPVDTAKTLVQSDLAKKTWVNARTTVPKVYAEGGFMKLYKGGLARTARLCGAFFILCYMREFVIQFKSQNAMYNTL